MKIFIISLLFLNIATLCSSQSIEKDKIYATQFLDHIFLNNQLHTKVKKVGKATIYILESNNNNEVTRELTRLSDSTFLYTEYYPISFEKYVKNHGDFGINKQGVLVITNETLIDSTVMYNYDTYEPYPNPRKRNILKPTGVWVEKYYMKYYKARGSYNSNGKHGEWNYYTSKLELDKTQTFKNGRLIKEEFINFLHYQSIEKTREVIQRTWSIFKLQKALDINVSKNSDTYTFEEDGTFIYTINRLENRAKLAEDIKKGTWSLIDYQTVKFIIDNEETILNLKYMSDRKIRF